MQTYLVGGAVRDRLLGLAQRDADYVVVGSTPEDMVAQGFRPVGADFPVFLHPQTQAEYALARTERKTGRGYSGFVFHTGVDVSLEEDLRRRDFTINAMAQTADGVIVDPYGGRKDLDARILRHVSDAFAEDPLRVLRAARFLARFAPLGFTLAPQTLALMRKMVTDGEVDQLVPERVWQETKRALVEDRPSAYVRSLRDCGALARLFPEVDCLYGVPQRAEYHPEVDTGAHLELVLDQCPVLAKGDDQVAFAALVHDLGKGLTPIEELPRHHAHEQRGVEPVRALCARLKVPAEHRDLAILVCKNHLLMHRFGELKPSTVFKLIEQLDALRRPDRARRFVLTCEADHRGRLGLSDRPYPQGQHLLDALAAAQAVSTAEIQARGLTGPAFGDALRLARIKAIGLVLEHLGTAD